MSTPGRSVCVYAQKAMVAAITAATMRRTGERGVGTRLSTCALSCHEGAHVVQAPGVEDVTRFDPAASSRADAEAHLACEPFGPMAVAVDGDGHAGRRCPARDRAVHVEMSGCAVDLHRGAGLVG